MSKYLCDKVIAYRYPSNWEGYDPTWRFIPTGNHINGYPTVFPGFSFNKDGFQHGNGEGIGGLETCGVLNISINRVLDEEEQRLLNKIAEIKRFREIFLD